MAEAMANRFAAERGLAVHAESAGTVPGHELNPIASLAMQEIGIPLYGHYPKMINSDMVRRTDRIISMGCGVDAESCPVRFMVAEDWNLSDPAGESIENVRAIRDEIARRVHLLLDDVEHRAQ